MGVVVFPVWKLWPDSRIPRSPFVSQAADLQLEMTRKPHKKPDPGETLVFGKTFTDHMLLVEWTENKGWSQPRIQPFQNFSLHPACSALHYSLQVARQPLYPSRSAPVPSRSACGCAPHPGSAFCVFPLSVCTSPVFGGFPHSGPCAGARGVPHMSRYSFFA